MKDAITEEILKEFFDLGFYPIPIFRNTLTGDISHPEWKTDIKSGKGIHDLTDSLRWLNNGLKNANGIALRMEPPNIMLDFDLKNTSNKNLFHTWLSVVANTNENILAKICYEITRSGGFHVYAKFPGITQKTRLASGEDGKEVIAIYAGDVLSYCYPTPGYEMKHNWFNDVEELTLQEFDLLVSCAAFFDEYEPTETIGEPMTEGDYPDEYKIICESFDKGCTDEIFEEELNDAGLFSTGKTGSEKRHGNTFHYFLRKGSESKFSAKVFFKSKAAYLFSGSYPDWPTFHTKHIHGFWKLTPSWIIYFSYERNWEKAIDIIHKYCDRLQIIIPEPKTTVQYCGYWTNNKVSTEINLSTGKLLDRLSKEFFILDGDYVQVKGGVIYKRDKPFIYRVIIDLVSEHDVQFKVHIKSDEVYFTIDKNQLKTKAQSAIRGNVALLAFPKFKSEILKDTAKEVFLHFKNKSVNIIGEGNSDYKRNNSKCIWEKQIINHEFSNRADEDSEFSKFIKNISGEKNFKAFKSAIGYVVRNYNGSDGLRAVWLCDEDYETGKMNGRTGKGIFAKAISKVRKTDECSGKDFVPDYQFKFQNMDLDTQVYIIDDVKKIFDFATMYNFCTEGAEYQKKFGDRVKLSIHETPKPLITSNFPPKIEDGASTLGRLLILPVKNYYLKYSEQGGVKHVHGHTFFDDWDKEEWNRFYSFIIECVQQYLKDGLIFPDLTQIEKNRLKVICADKLQSDDQAEDFVNWIYEKDPKDFESFQLVEMKKDFEVDAEIDNRIFSGCLKAFFDLKGYKVRKTRVRTTEGHITKWHCVQPVQPNSY